MTDASNEQLHSVLESIEAKLTTLEESREEILNQLELKRAHVLNLTRSIEALETLNAGQRGD